MATGEGTLIDRAGPGRRVHVQIDGAAIVDIASFYAEINRVFMAGEDWALGESLDALHDMLFGGYGVIAGADAVTISWKDMARSRAALGVGTSLAFLEDRLKIRSQFNGQPIAVLIDQLRKGQGDTYFDIVMQIFAEHPHIRIIAG